MSEITDRKIRKAIWNKLKSVALEDGIFSEEEQRLMGNIIVDIEKYSKKMEKALADNIIDEEEEKELFEGRMNILEKAYETARDDMVISDDEKNILKTMCKIIMEIEDKSNVE